MDYLLKPTAQFFEDCSSCGEECLDTFLTIYKLDGATLQPICIECGKTQCPELVKIVELHRRAMALTKDEGYRKIEEWRFLGSDLNKFVKEECRKDMTCINVDTLLYRWYSGGPDRLRLIEYKHGTEELGDNQLAVLKRLAEDFNKLNSLDKGMVREVCVVKGNLPHNTVSIQCLNSSRTVDNIEPAKLQRWLSFEDELH